MAENYKLVTHCTVEDAVGLSHAKIESFVKEPWWTSEFPPDRTETILESMILREPYNQLMARNIRRHQKVIYVPTGEIVGYSRWFVPSPEDWLEAQTPAVSEEEEETWKIQYQKAYWHFVEDGMGTDDHVSAWRADLTPTGPVISTSGRPVRYHQRLHKSCLLTVRCQASSICAVSKLTKSAAWPACS